MVETNTDVKDILDALEGRQRYHAHLSGGKYPHENIEAERHYSVVGCDDGTCDHIHSMLKPEELDGGNWYWCKGSILNERKCD